MDFLLLLLIYFFPCLSVLQVVAQGLMRPIPLFWLAFLTETAQEMQQQQQQGMQLSLQQHAACCRSFQLQLLLPLVQFVLQRLQHILDHPEPHASGHAEIGEGLFLSTTVAVAPIVAVVAAGDTPQPCTPAAVHARTAAPAPATAAGAGPAVAAAL